MAKLRMRASAVISWPGEGCLFGGGGELVAEHIKPLAGCRKARVRRIPRLHSLEPREQAAGEIDTVLFYASGKLILGGGGSRNTPGELLSWEVDTGNVRQRHFGLSSRVVHLSASKDGKIIAALADGMVRIWNRTTSSEALALRADPQEVAAIAFAPDGFSFATAGRSGRVSLWNSSAGSETLNLSFPGAFEPAMPGIVEWFAEHPPGDATG